MQLQCIGLELSEKDSKTQGSHREQHGRRGRIKMERMLQHLGHTETRNLSNHVLLHIRTTESTVCNLIASSITGNSESVGLRIGGTNDNRIGKVGVLASGDKVGDFIDNRPAECHHITKHTILLHIPM